MDKDKLDKTCEVYAIAEEFARRRYEEEVAREVSLLSQASNMQTVFSVASAALFMLLPTIADAQYRGNLSLGIIYWFMSAIVILLVSSLLLATAAQSRKMRTIPLSMDSLITNLAGPEGKQKYLNSTFLLYDEMINLYAEALKSLSENNAQRVKLIQISMNLFYAALGICAVFYVVSTGVLFG